MSKKSTTTDTQELEIMPNAGQPIEDGQSLAVREALPVTAESERMLSMIERMATDPQCDPAKLREILAVKQLWEKDEARKAFAHDMARFQSQCPIITKGDKAYDKAYARIDRIHRETRSLRRECGFWFTWSVCEIKDNVAYMEGLLGHSGGHTVQLKQVIPLPDVLKGQNATQRAGSAMTYAKRYGECLALDIVTGEDDDGNGLKERPQGSATVVDSPLETLRKELWAVLKPVRGDKLDWHASNSWLWKEEIIDGAVPERAPHFTEQRFKEVIAKVKAKLGN